MILNESRMRYRKPKDMWERDEEWKWERERERERERDEKIVQKEMSCLESSLKYFQTVKGYNFVFFTHFDTCQNNVKYEFIHW